MPSLADDRDAIRDLLARYIRVADAGCSQAEAWVAFYTDDAEFHQQGAPPVVGKEALLEFGKTLPDGGIRHMITDHVIDVDGDRATCEATVALVVGGKWFGTGRATDELRRVDGAWKIARRSFAPDA
jgi:ketosteroid isomerase-like protein